MWSRREALRVLLTALPLAPSREPNGFPAQTRVDAWRSLFDGTSLGHWEETPFGGEGLSGTGPKAGGPHYVARFATERVTCIDTTAAGGNATLMAAIEG